MREKIAGRSENERKIASPSKNPDEAKIIITRGNLIFPALTVERDRSLLAQTGKTRVRERERCKDCV